MTSQAFAIYRSTETAVRYFNGAGYVVRHEMFPHTTSGPSGPVTRQGHAMLTGIRQGTGTDGGFTTRRYARPDTSPLAGRFAAIADGSLSEQRGAAGNHEREACGYGALMRQVAHRLADGTRPCEVAGLLALIRDAEAERLSAGGFDALRMRQDCAAQDLWLSHGRLSACRTALEILVS